MVSFSRKGWYLYFLVGIYIVYKGVKFLMDMTGGSGEALEDENAKGKKKKDKKRDENKPKVKYVKH